MAGRWVVLEPLDAERHGGDLAAAFAPAPDSLWTYMSIGPFASRAEVIDAIGALASTVGMVPFAVCVDGVAQGFAAYMRIDAAHGVIEIGSIALSPQLQRTRAATEALFVLVDHALGLGYRRVEWKCDSYNEPSRRAARRLGFSYEGTFRQATHYKGRTRDTAWYAVIDREWPPLRAAFLAWLDPSNFTADGAQCRVLASFRTPPG